jgi:rhodanese-related sulfurtransferase
MVTKQKAWKDIDTNQIKELLNNKGIELIDVREVDEYQSGHIPGVKNIPLSEFTGRTNEIDADKEVVCICRSGNRSEKACEYLSTVGYKKLSNMVGGMKDWDGDIE